MSVIHSVGTLYAIQDLFLDLENRRISADEFRLCNIKFGTSTAKDVYETAYALDWICTSSGGEIVATTSGREAHPRCDRPTKLRFQLRSIVEKSRPPWAALLVNGRREASVSFPVEIRQCFKEANLLEVVDDDVIIWWDQLSACMREEAALQRTKIGRLGERLTLRFELERTGSAPKWQAFETNFAGYDVLSIKNRGNSRRLKIEVKASTRRFKEAFINITEHEWNTALTSPQDYVFHIWILTENEEAPRKFLFIIPSSEIAQHIPSNQGNGFWKQASIRMGAITNASNAVVLKQ
jgi:hypothetical protein